MAIVNTSWLNENAYRVFPLNDNSTGIATNTTWAIPNSLLVDVALYVPLNVDPTEVFISEITIAGSIVKIIFSNNEGVLASSLFDYVDHEQNDTYAIRGVGSSNSTIFGRLTAGFIDMNQPELVPGTHQFDYDAGALATICVRPSPESVTALNVGGQRLSGEVQLIGDRGVSITAAGNTISITADILGSLNLSDCGCEDSIDNCIKTINGVSPDSSGNINLVGVDCLQLTEDPVAHTIFMSDTCSQPCCDCDGLETMARNIEELRQRSISLEDFIRDIQNRIRNAAAYLESRL